MRLLTDIPAAELKDRYVFLRGSLNVPVRDGVVLDDFRLQQLLPTIKYLQEREARIILAGHIGREANETLQPVQLALAELGIETIWGGRVGEGSFATARADLLSGQVLLLENLRQDPREVVNDSGFVSELAATADLYINDAFADSHREHASIFGLPQRLPSYAGLGLAKEVTELSKALNPIRPSLLILGGAKFDTKIPLLEKLLPVYDCVFIGGALLNDVLLATGYEVGRSLVSEVSLVGRSWLKDSKIVPVIDVVVRSGEQERVCLISEVQPAEMIVDMGPETVASLRGPISEAKTILWNGPLGLYESGAKGSTHAVVELAAASKAFSVVGGGDTIAAIADLAVEEKLGFVSTGGGAMLTFLEQGTLPGIRVLG